VYPIQGEITLLQAIALAGGPSNLADPSKTVIFRKKGNAMKAYNLNLDAIREGKMQDPYILNDDRVIVHRSGSRYWMREIGTLLSPVRVLDTLVQ
jgi:polysaccharide export outer membrane protein